MDFWAIVGRLAVIVTILTAVFKFIAWWRSPREKLNANVLPGPFELPPSVETEFNLLADNVRQAVDAFLKRYPKKEDGYDEAFYRGTSLADDVRYAVKGQLSYETRSFAGCWHARVENRGKMKCSGVNLHLPHATLARIQRDSDREPMIMPIKGLITIGELRPRGHCYVTAWTDQRVANRDNYDVVLTHDLGIGRVSGQWQTTRLGWILGTLIQRENLLSLFVPLFFAVLGIFFTALGLIPLLSKTTHPTTPHSQGSPAPTASPSLSPR